MNNNNKFNVELRKLRIQANIDSIVKHRKSVYSVQKALGRYALANNNKKILHKKNEFLSSNTCFSMYVSMNMALKAAINNESLHYEKAIIF